jgi:hypothetical protein
LKDFGRYGAGVFAMRTGEVRGDAATVGLREILMQL